MEAPSSYEEVIDPSKSRWSSCLVRIATQSMRVKSPIPLGLLQPGNEELLAEAAVAGAELDRKLCDPKSSDGVCASLLGVCLLTRGSPAAFETLLFYKSVHANPAFADPDVIERIMYFIGFMQMELPQVWLPIWRYVVPLLHAGPSLQKVRYFDCRHRGNLSTAPQRWPHPAFLHPSEIGPWITMLRYTASPAEWVRTFFDCVPPAAMRGVQYYNPHRNRMRHLVHFRRAADAHRDAWLVLQAAAEGRPLELGKRLRLGRLAGGHTTGTWVTVQRRVGGTAGLGPAAPSPSMAAEHAARSGAGCGGDGGGTGGGGDYARWEVLGGCNALTAACAGGHGECVRVLARGVRGAGSYVKRRDPGGRGCWEVAVGDAMDALEELRRDPAMQCGDLPACDERGWHRGVAPWQEVGTGSAEYGRLGDDLALGLPASYAATGDPVLSSLHGTGLGSSLY